jgi:uncharacterized membrane protein HdeD (DUF308 family)
VWRPPSTWIWRFGAFVSVAMLVIGALWCWRYFADDGDLFQLVGGIVFLLAGVFNLALAFNMRRQARNQESSR